MLRARFGQLQYPGIEFEGRERVPRQRFGRGGAPVETAGDHEVEHEPKFALETERNSFAHAPYFAYGLAEYGLERRGRGAKKERAADVGTFQLTPNHAVTQSLDVDDHVRKLGHSKKFLEEPDGAAAEAYAEPKSQRQNGRQPGETGPFVDID